LLPCDRQAVNADLDCCRTLLVFAESEKSQAPFSPVEMSGAKQFSLRLLRVTTPAGSGVKHFINNKNSSLQDFNTL
jgi:hypothetical protein